MPAIEKSFTSLTFDSFYFFFFCLLSPSLSLSLPLQTPSFSPSLPLNLSLFTSFLSLPFSSLTPLSLLPCGSSSLFFPPVLLPSLPLFYSSFLPLSPTTTPPFITNQATINSKTTFNGGQTHSWRQICPHTLSLPPLKPAQTAPTNTATSPRHTRLPRRHNRRTSPLPSHPCRLHGRRIRKHGLLNMVRHRSRRQLRHPFLNRQTPLASGTRYLHWRLGRHWSYPPRLKPIRTSTLPFGPASFTYPSPRPLLPPLPARAV